MKKNKTYGNEETNDIRTSLVSPNLSNANFNINLSKSPYDFKKKEMQENKAEYNTAYQRSATIGNGGMNIVSGEKFKTQCSNLNNQAMFSPNKHLKEFIDEKQIFETQGSYYL